MLLNLRGVSTPDEWENANDAKINAIFQDLPVLIIGNPNREVNSQGEIIEHQPTYTGENGWPENYEMAGSKDEKETFWTEGPGDVTSQERSQGSRSRSSRERGEFPRIMVVSTTRKWEEHSYPLPRARDRQPSTPSSTLVHQQRSVDSETTAIDTPPFPRAGSSRFLTVDVGVGAGLRPQRAAILLNHPHSSFSVTLSLLNWWLTLLRETPGHLISP